MRLRRFETIPATVWAAQYLGTVSPELRTLADGLVLSSTPNSVGTHKLLVAGEGFTPFALNEGDWLVRDDDGRAWAVLGGVFWETFHETTGP